jgi:hypothetical protein
MMVVCVSAFGVGGCHAALVFKLGGVRRGGGWPMGRRARRAAGAGAGVLDPGPRALPL